MHARVQLVTVHDPVTMRQVWIDPEKYWRYPFKASASAKQMIEYVILGVEVGSFVQTSAQLCADVEVARASDLGTNDTTFFVKTHLSNILQPGDTAMGYDLSNTRRSGARKVFG